ncbi:MAG: hypothetical protein ACREWI_10775, partial [Telluria sp.]
EQDSVRAALEKREAQRALLEHAQRHAETQRKAAQATRRMAEARKELAALESQRQDEHAAELASTERAIVARKAEAEQRVASVNITREVLGRFKQPVPASASQAVTRLADVISSQRKNEGD